jgi:hypothetical protein
LPEAVLCGPAQCGDVYRACRNGAETILLVDGYFDHALSVWHKEILWALSHGTRVAGAASMGALRAAELDVFGMLGVGTVYELFRSGELEDDDEVAVLHEPSERDYTPRSDAMVNLRLTARAAVSAGTIERGTELRLVAAAKRLFYADRTFDRMVAEGELDSATRARLGRWLAAHGLVDQKRLDAEALLALAARSEWVRAPTPKFKFEATNPWNALRRRIDGELAQASSSVKLPSSVDERFWSDWLVGLGAAQPELHARLWNGAVERALGLLLARQLGIVPTPAQVQSESEHFRRELGLFTPEDTAAWLTRNQLDVPGFSGMSHDLAIARIASNEVRRVALSQLPWIARELGCYFDARVRSPSTR